MERSSTAGRTGMEDFSFLAKLSLYPYMDLLFLAHSIYSSTAILILEPIYIMRIAYSSSFCKLGVD
jgi:hypothetical protein